MALYFCGATSDIGVGRELQEDFVQLCELDDNNLFCVIADGTGSMPQRPQPAAIVAMDIVKNIKDTFEQQKDLLLSCPGFFIRKPCRKQTGSSEHFKWEMKNCFPDIQPV